LAQRNTIAKWQERICWGILVEGEYVGGICATTPTPFPGNDIMVSGWLGNQIAGYVAATSRSPFTRKPGSISFRHPRGMRYDYDLHSLTEVLSRNFRRIEVRPVSLRAQLDLRAVQRVWDPAAADS